MRCRQERSSGQASPGAWGVRSPGRAPSRPAPEQTAPERTAPERTGAELPGPGRATGFLFLLATLGCAAALAATYYFFVRTTTGQFIDESALVEAVEIHGAAGKASNKLLGWPPCPC